MGTAIYYEISGIPNTRMLRIGVYAGLLRCAWFKRKKLRREKNTDSNE
jgi:uncharacterized protein YodC (DUF2158 family)